MKRRNGKIKIAYLFTPIEFGGAEKVNLNFLHNVNRKRFDIYPVLLVRPWEKENIFINKLGEEKYPVHKIPTTTRKHSEGRGYLRFLRGFWYIYSYLKKGHFDLLHTHGYFADILGIPAAKALRIPCISTCHGFISNDKKLMLYNTVERIMLRFTNKTLVVSEEIKAGLLQSGISESRIKVIPNAVPLDSSYVSLNKNRTDKRHKLNISEDELVLGYIGRLSIEKGCNYLIKAVRLLKKLGVPVKVLIIGDGPQKKELEDLVYELDIENLVIFVGFQPDVDRWLPTFDIFVLPSMTEGTPMSLLEAMASGIPAVASAVGGIPQVVDSGENGVLVSPGDPEEIRDAVYKLYKNENLRKSISTAALDTIRSRYNIKDWIGKIEAEYYNLINNR